ncbi:MAG: SUMF1/EgtB/PvdO family nonheme iron enzyme [Anaerolineales bacterium]|nr:SUMF1/EgtB/PvdO family nonheme iron enzyme [Anaerolineales bacterium]
MAEPSETMAPAATQTPLPTEPPEAVASPTPTATEMPEATELPTETPVPTLVEPEPPTIGSSRIFETDQMEQVYVPAGEFIMGSSDIEAKITIEGGRAYPEIPVHSVNLDGYWIDKYEISNAQYGLCVDAGVCRAPYLSTSETRQKYFGNPEYSNYPVIWVSWYMAGEYCEWAGRRLPTEAEWEKASRGTDGRKYPWGNEPMSTEPLSGERANFCDVNCQRTIANGRYDDGYADTAPVGSYPAGASPYGGMDMSGNVWEWTSTIIQPYPYDATDGREDMTNINAERVWRGGPWTNGYWWMRSSVRYRSIPTYWYVNLGFRCASSE